MYTVEQIESTNLRHRLQENIVRFKDFKKHRRPVGRSPETVVGFLDRDMAQKIIDGGNEEMIAVCVGITVITNGEIFFIADDPSYGHPLLPDNFMGFTVKIPTTPSCEAPENSSITNVDQLIRVYNKRMHHINSLDELCLYLNRQLNSKSQS